MAGDGLPASPRDRLHWAAELTSGYGGPASRGTGEPVFTALPELVGAVEWAATSGGPGDVETALAVADVLGAAWERLGALQEGRERLDRVLVAASRVGLRDDLGVARVLRRRARLAMAARDDDEADEDLQRAHAIAVAHCEPLVDPVVDPFTDPVVVSLLLDRADLAMRRGRWGAAAELVPELLRRTDATGDPLLQAMGLNRAGWAAFGGGERATAQERYEQAWALAELHEDPVVESRSASGLALLAMLGGDLGGARRFWRHALVLAEQVHDRSFTLHCLDGIAALLVLQGDEGLGARLGASVTQVRDALQQPREEALRPVHELVVRAAEVAEEPWSYAEALAVARAAVA